MQEPNRTEFTFRNGRNIQKVVRSPYQISTAQVGQIVVWDPRGQENDAVAGRIEKIIHYLGPEKPPLTSITIQVEN